MVRKYKFEFICKVIQLYTSNIWYEFICLSFVVCFIKYLELLQIKYHQLVKKCNSVHVSVSCVCCATN